MFHADWIGEYFHSTGEADGIVHHSVHWVGADAMSGHDSSVGSFACGNLIATHVSWRASFVEESECSGTCPWCAFD